MSSILETIEPTNRTRHATSGDSPHRGLPELISDPCQALLAEAEALGLDLDDVLAAVRNCAASRNNSN